MKLNIECLRDMLLTFEQNLTVDNRTFNSMDLVTLEKELSQYNKDDVWYTLFQLFESKYIDGDKKPGGLSPMMFPEIHNLRPESHQFLESIRSDDIWIQVKNKLSELGEHSIRSATIISRELCDNNARNISKK